MVKIASAFSALVAVALSGLAMAHPNTYSEAELVKRQEFQTHARRSVAGCQSKLRARGGLAERAIARRQAFAERARKERGLIADMPFLRKRDIDEVLNTSHHSNLTGLTADTDPSTLFDGNTSCVLAPETTEGPYLVDGEYIRENLTEGEEGVTLYLDVELIDVTSCDPVTGIYVDIWSANSTGVYSGVVASSNGNGDEDPSNLNNTALRGLQQTSDEGVVQFITLFPGHYTGRTNHIHVMAHQTDGSLNDNGTYTGGSVSHVGQIFFDQDLINSVEEISPYSTNTQVLWTNDEDDIMAQESDGIDPVAYYVLLGDSISDGLLGWVSFGINTTASYNVSEAATLTEDGGVANPDDTAGVPSGSPSGSGASGSALPSQSSASA